MQIYKNLYTQACYLDVSIQCARKHVVARPSRHVHQQQTSPNPYHMSRYFLSYACSCKLKRFPLRCTTRLEMLCKNAKDWVNYAISFDLHYLSGYNFHISKFMSSSSFSERFLEFLLLSLRRRLDASPTSRHTSRRTSTVDTLSKVLGKCLFLALTQNGEELNRTSYYRKYFSTPIISANSERLNAKKKGASY